MLISNAFKLVRRYDLYFLKYFFFLFVIFSFFFVIFFPRFPQYFFCKCFLIYFFVILVVLQFPFPVFTCSAVHSLVAFLPLHCNVLCVCLLFILTSFYCNETANKEKEEERNRKYTSIVISNSFSLVKKLNRFICNFNFIL